MTSQKSKGKSQKGKRACSLLTLPFDFCLLTCYLVVGSAPAFLRLSQLYLRWNFSTRPVVSTYFILPVKNGWQAEQISTVMFLRVLRVVNLLPQPQVTVASTYWG